MNDFWLAFLAGLASGVVIVVVSTLFRRLFKRRSESEPIKLSKKELRPLVVMTVALILIFIDVFLFDNGGYLIGIGAVLLGLGSVEFLS